MGAGNISLGQMTRWEVGGDSTRKKTAHYCSLGLGEKEPLKGRSLKGEEEKEVQRLETVLLRVGNYEPRSWMSSASNRKPLKRRGKGRRKRRKGGSRLGRWRERRS